MKKKAVFISLLGILCSALLVSIYLTGCSSSSEPAQVEKVTISGVLNLPAAASGKTWVVMIDNDMDGDNGSTAMSFGVCGSGTTVSYQIQNIPAGTYYIYSVVFVVSDGEGAPVAGDYIGIYGGDFPFDIPTQPNATVNASHKEFDIDLVVMPDLLSVH